MSVRDEYATRCMIPSDISQHLPTLYNEASIGDAQIIELGVRSGNSTAAFLAAVEQYGGHVWSVDITPPRLPWVNHPHWTVLVGDDLWLADDLPDDVDVLFIDTSHYYQHTCAELAMFVPKVKPGGVVLLHDTELENPEGRPDTDPPFPVRVAVEEFCADNGLTPEFIEGSWGLGVIRIPGGE